MADPARGAVRASRLETFHRILRLEDERGYDDRAVMGGLDRFLAAWRQELEQEPQGSLLDHLTRLGVDTLITCGESTSGCVRASVVDGCTNRYRMIVVEECVFDRHQATHAINLFDMHQKYADVLPLAEVLEWLAGG